MVKTIGKMALVKEESQEYELKQMLLNQQKWELKPIGKVKQEAHKPVPLDESDFEDGFHLKIITLEAKKEEVGDWDPDAFETSVELNTNARDVNQGLSSEGRLNESCDNGPSSLAAGENLAHSPIPTGENPYQCSQYGESVFKYDSLKTHTTQGDCVKLNGKKYCCSHCGKTFGTLIHFIVHQQIHRGDGRERPFHCSQCGKSFYREKGLKTHQQRHKGERPYRCSKCGKLFNVKSLLLSHQRSHTRERLYHCSKCARSFASKTNFERHMQMYLKEILYSCSQCKKNFSTECSLNRHKKTHIRKETNSYVKQLATKEKIYSCSHCSRTFTVLTHYIVHQQIHRGEGTGERPFCCKQCGKRFYREHGLKLHEESHRNEKIHCCSECGKSFRTESVLISHKCACIKKRHYCSKCGRSFTLKSTFESHMQMHSGQKKYSVSPSVKSQPAEHSHSRHKETHTGKVQVLSFQQAAPKTKSYSCSHCGRTFTTLTNYIVHQQIHRGEGREERPFCCSQCGKRFYREDSLKKHHQIHTGGRSHQCSQCGKSFRTKSVLLSHQNIHERQKLDHHLMHGGGFASESYSDEHIHMQSSERLHNCSWCREMFPTEYFLKRHKQSHCKKRSLWCFKQTQTKKYCCSNCGKVFTTLTNFVVHQQIHRTQGRAERPVYFSQSGKCFYRENGLKSHQQTLTGESSPENDRSLNTKTHFGKRTNEGLRSYHCSYCEKTFTTSSVLKQHQQIHIREGTGCDEHLQNATRETSLGDSCLANDNSASTKNSGGGKIVLGEDGKRERQNTIHFETLPKFGMDDCIEHRVHLERFSDLQNTETRDDTSERPHIGFDVIPLFYPEVCHTVESTRSTSAVKTGAVGAGEVLNIHNTGTSFESRERPRNSVEITSVPSNEEALECDLKPEVKHCKWRTVSVNEMKQENNEYVQLKDSHVAEDRQSLQDTQEEMKKEEGEDKQGFAVKTEFYAPELNENIVYFNQHTQNHSYGTSHMENITTQGVTFYQKNQTEETYPCFPWANNIEKDLDAHLRSSTGRKSSFQQVPSGNKMYCCSHCGRRFNTSVKYVVHLQIHRRDGKEERPFSCPQCGKSFYREEGLKTHQQSHTVERAGGGPQTGKLAGTSGLTGHQQNDTAEKLQRCPQGDQSFTCQRPFWAHQQLHADKSCNSYCGEMLTDSGLKQRQEMNTGVTNGFIPSASNGQPLGEMLTGHTLNGSTLRPRASEYPVCTESFSGATNANVQMIRNTKSMFESEEKPVRSVKMPPQECILAPKMEHHCGWELESKDQMKEEDNGHIPIADCMEDIPLLKIITLDEVKMEDGGESLILQSSTDLNSTPHYVNLRTPTVDRHNGSFPCATTSTAESVAPHRPVYTMLQHLHCGKSLIAEDNLRIHQQTHMSESCHFQQIPSVDKSYLCARCGKSFTTLTNYFVHLQIHRGERPFSCSQCGKSYYKEESLKTHQQNHIGGKH